MSSSSVESGLTGLTRVNVTLEKHIPKKHKFIKLAALSPFIPVNKISLNEDNYDNPETTDTSLSGKDDMSQISRDDFTGKTNDKTIIDHDEDYKEETSKRKKGNESFDNSETSDNLCGDSIILTTKNI